METYQKLAALFESGESGVLSLPNFPAFIAKPVSLSYMTVTRPDILRYQFVFWEDSKNSVSVPEISRFRMHVTVKEDGENLWTIAQKEHTTVEELLRLNPHIVWPSYLTEGLQVTYAMNYCCYTVSGKKVALLPPISVQINVHEDAPADDMTVIFPLIEQVPKIANYTCLEW